MSAWGLEDARRTWSLVPSRKRRRCACCQKRATHFGLGGSVVLVTGCEWYVRTWIRSPSEAWRMVARLNLDRAREGLEALRDGKPVDDAALFGALEALADLETDPVR